MKLHTNPEEFRELISIVAREKNISESAVERDYYIVMMLKALSERISQISKKSLLMFRHR